MGGVQIGLSVDPERARLLGLVDDEPPDPPEDLPPIEDHAGLLHAQMVRDELRRMRARADAKTILDTERRGPLPPFDLGTLADVLARPAEPPSRVDGLIPWQASSLLTAQRKTGKTTLVLNLARSLLTGEDFLGRFPVRPVDGLIGFLNFEVSAGQLARWAHEVGVPADRLYLVNVRGRRNPLTDVDDRQALALQLRGRAVETLIVDPFGRAYTGTSQNDAGEVSGWLTRLDQWARGDVGARDLVLTAHAGWNGERTRGSTALEDWADVILTLTRYDAEDAGGERYLRALGRDVDLEEDRLDFDPDTRRLTLSGAGSRRQRRATQHHDELDRAVLAVITAHPGVNGSKLGPLVRESGIGFQGGQERHAASRLVDIGRVRVEIGKRGAKCYFPADVSPPLPTSPDVTPGTSPDLSLRGEVPIGHVNTRRVPTTECAVCGAAMTIVEPGQTPHPGCDTDAP